MLVISVCEKRLIVIDLYDGESKFALVNPELVWHSDEMEEFDEGCLSFPNQFGKVRRYSKVKVKAHDLEGNNVNLEAEGLLAQALQHEIDHLNGHLFKEKIIPGTFEVITPEDVKNKKK